MEPPQQTNNPDHQIHFQSLFHLLTILQSKIIPSDPNPKNYLSLQPYISEQDAIGLCLSSSKPLVYLGLTACPPQTLFLLLNSYGLSPSCVDLLFEFICQGIQAKSITVEMVKNLNNQKQFDYNFVMCALRSYATSVPGGLIDPIINLLQQLG